MEFISFAIPFAALVFLTVIVGGLMNYYMDQRGLAYNPYLTYLLLPAIVGALYLVGGFSMWTVKGIVLSLILLYASVQDVNEHQADEFLWVMLLILSLVNFGKVGVTSMVFGALGVFIPQMAIGMFAKKGGIGGADIKLSTAAALSLGFYGGVIGYCIGIVFAITVQLLSNITTALGRTILQVSTAEQRTVLTVTTPPMSTALTVQALNMNRIAAHSISIILIAPLVLL